MRKGKKKKWLWSYCDINPLLFGPDLAVELADLDLESTMPDSPATSTTPSCDDMWKEDLQEEEEVSKFFKTRMWLLRQLL
uniref:Uncharacterized protein n=1 Tax=Amphimedon queenslandica TaxID=400682 RepID=A0A1X7U836_AMPQE